MGRAIRVGQILRYTSEKNPAIPAIDGFPNFHYVTESPGRPRALLEAGINSMANVREVAGERRPAVLIRSSPWKAGSEQTPWHDIFDMSNGHVRYFGDHKVTHVGPTGTTTGNASLLKVFDDHQAPLLATRMNAAPLLVFRAVSRNGRVKGFVEFCGVGLIERAERVVQWAGHERETFTNYVFDLALIDLTSEDDQVDWDWITARRDPGVSAATALSLAPRRWQDWVQAGSSVLPRLRRRIARSRVVKPKDRRPATGSPEAADLALIHRRYDGDKHSFETLAAAVAGRVLRGSGHSYRDGWLTRRSGDGGADFVGRLDLGSGLAGTSLVVLGQAKCVLPKTLISAEQIARVVARLQRGWIGVFVTTGTFSEPAQLEMVEDQYPIVLIDGLCLVDELRQMARDNHGGDLSACIEHIMASDTVTIMRRRPEEILLE